jgi:hypothetical protein
MRVGSSEYSRRDDSGVNFVLSNAFAIPSSFCCEIVGSHGEGEAHGSYVRKRRSGATNIERMTTLEDKKIKIDDKRSKVPM